MNNEDTIPNITVPDVRNSSYSIDGELFNLVDGKAEKEIVKGSAMKQTVSIFGQPSYGDLNADGEKDAICSKIREIFFILYILP